MRETPVSEGERLFFLMFFDVVFGEADQVWGVDQSHLRRLFFRLLDRPSVAQHPPDHPEGPDPNRRRAMNERGTIFRIVGNLEKFIRLFVFWLAVNDRDVEVAQPQLLRLRFFFGSAMFAGLSKIDDRFHSIGLELGQMLDTGLAAGAELFIDLQEISYRWDFLGRLR